MIATLAVHPDYRRRGVGARLLEECEARLSSARIRLTVRADNLPAQRLYERFGYQQVGQVPNYYAHGHPGITMEKAR